MDDDFRQQCALLGLDPNRLIPPERQTTQPENAELWPWYLSAWRVFWACQTQWVWVGGGMGAPVRCGLNYAGVQCVMDAELGAEQLRGKKARQAWWALRVMEVEALQVYSERAK